MVELQRPGVRIERDDRSGEEVVTRSRPRGLPFEARPVVEWCRVAGAPPPRVRLGVVSTGHPPAAAARAPRIVAPRLLGFFRPRHRQELPHLLAAGGVDPDERTRG